MVVNMVMDQHRSSALAAKELVEQMTLKEKVGVCSGEDFWHLKSCKRLDLAPIMVTDGPHGLRKQKTEGDHLGIFNSVPATCFPTASALASSWDAALLARVGEALGEQCLAEKVAVILGPGLNIKRHPRGGRNFEYFSEDPLHSGVMAAAMVNGIQSKGVGACVKHFAVNNQESHRMVTDAVVDERTLREIYLRGFEIVVKESNPWSIMTAYNRLNGSYCSENDYLTNKVLRDEWGYEGMVVSDWLATVDRVAGLNSGMDLEMPGNKGQNDARIIQAINSDVLSVTTLDKVVIRVVALILKSMEGNKVNHHFDQDAHHRLAREAACKSAVLLKNNNNLLPIKPGLRIAVIGDFAKKPRYQGSGSSLVNPTHLECFWDAITKWVAQQTDETTRLEFAKGYDAKNCDVSEELIAEAISVAKNADLVIVFAGLPDSYESEGIDRAHIDLPEQHNRLIEAVASVNSATAVVLSNGSAVAMPWVSEVAAVLECYLAGQASGSAIVDLLTGAANPCGKLAETFAVRQQDALSDSYFPGVSRQVQYREGLYVGYRYFNTVSKGVLFPFGHGLSYTRFDYQDITLDAQVYMPNSDSNVLVTGVIKNCGDIAGDEIVQVYVHATEPSVHRPAQVLAGFTKVALNASESKPFTVAVDKRAFMYYCVDLQDWVVDGGSYVIQVGASSRDIRCSRQLTIAANQSTSSNNLRNNSETSFFRDLPAQNLSVPDDVFRTMLGRDIPEPDLSHPITQNSTFGEIAQSRLGAWFSQFVSRKIKAELGDNDKDTDVLLDHMFINMPLRALVLLGSGEFSYKQLDSLIYFLNGNYLKGIVNLLQRK